MAVIRPIYRLTLFQPRSQDPTETAVLVPAAGAPHSDGFRVATHRIPGDTSGLWKPILEMPHGGRRSRIDPITKQADVGSMTAELTDVKLAADDESARWLSAFIGDANGVDQLKNLRGQWEESLDGGFAWQHFWAGRTQDAESRGRLGVRIPMRDEVDRFKVPLFVGLPHASIADVWQAPLLPYGRMTLVPGIGAKRSLQAAQDTTYLDMTATGESGGFPQWFTPSYVDATKKRWYLTKALWDKAADIVKALWVRVLYFEPDAVQLEVEDAGTVLGRFAVRAIFSQQHDDLYLVKSIAVEELPATDPDFVAYPALSTVYGGALVTPKHAGPSEASPLFLGSPNPINVVTLIAAILDGKFGRLDENGDPLDVIRRRTGSFNALASSIPYTYRDRIDAETTIDEWLPKHLLEPFDLALVPDAEGYLDLVSLARPTTILAPSSITDAEIVAEPDAEHWRHSDKDIVNAVEVKTRYWSVVDLDDLLAAARETSDNLLEPPPGLIDIVEYPPLQFLSAEQGEASREFDFGLQNHETHLQGMVPGEALEYGRIHARDLFARFGTGPHYVTYRRRRTAADGTRIDAACDVGSRRSLETSGVPDLATHVRGINRLGLCIERQPDPGWVDLTFLDEGANATADEPTLGDLVLADGTVVGTVVDPTHSVVVDAPAVNAAGDPVRIDIAVTAPGDSLPATGSSLWQTVTAPGYRPDGLTPLAIRGQPNGQRVWVRGRSEPLSGGALLPSAWVFPVPDSVVLDALTAPSGLIVSNIGPTAADLAWTVGDADLASVVLVDDAVVETLPAGSSTYRLTGIVPGAGLTPNTNYDVSVVHVDATGGYTAATTANFTTLASGAALPRPAGLQQLRPSAITLALFAADAGIPLVLQRAPDSAGAPDLGSIETIATDLPGTTTTYTDPQPVGPTLWWYRLAHGSGAVVGPWLDWISAIAESGDVPDPTYIRPTVVVTPSETSTDATLDLAIEDPQGRVTAVEFRARQGTAAWSAWVADTTPYSATVPITAGNTSQIGWRVLGYDETGTVITLASGTETFGAPDVSGNALAQSTDGDTLWSAGPGEDIELTGIGAGRIALLYSVDGGATWDFFDSDGDNEGPFTSLEVTGTRKGTWAITDVAAQAEILYRVVTVTESGTVAELDEALRDYRYFKGVKRIRLKAQVKTAGSFSTDPVITKISLETSVESAAATPPPDPDPPDGVTDPGPPEDTYPVARALLFWGICDKGTFQDDGTGLKNVAQINDLSGSANHLGGDADISGAFVRRLTRIEDASAIAQLNGRDPIAFRDAWLPFPTDMFDGVTEGELFAVIRADNADPANLADRDYFHQLGPSDDARLAESTGGGANTGRIREDFGSTVLHDTGDFPGTLDEWFIYNVRAGSGHYRIYKYTTAGGAQLAFTSDTNTVDFSAAPKLGNRGQNSDYLMAEYAIHSAILTTEERALVIAELLSRWAI